MAHTETTLDTIVALAKRRGFVYPTSEIYAVWQIPTTMAPWAQNCSRISATHGGANLSPNEKIWWG